MALIKWSHNKVATLLQGNYDGYIQSSLLQLRLVGAIGDGAANGTAVYNIEPGITYKVRLYMDTRFRVAACSSIAMNTVMENYYRDSDDFSNTTVAGVYKEAEITSQTDQVYMPVVYWASGGSKTWQEVFDTIEVYEQLTGMLNITPPNKISYNVGDELDMTGMSVVVAWSDGNEEIVTDYTISGFDSTKAGACTVTVTHKGEKAEFDVTVAAPPVVTGIEVIPPAKIEYIIGEAFDSTGLVVNIVYQDGSRQATSDYILSGFDSSVIGSKTITVTYNKFTITFDVIITEEYTVIFHDWDGTILKTQTVMWGETATAPDSPIREGYTFTGWDKAFISVKEDLTVTAQYTINIFTVTFVDWNGKILKVQSVEYGKSADAPAISERVDYEFTGWDKEFLFITEDITITALYMLTITGIEIVSVPTKMSYILNEDFDSTGLIVCKIKRDGTKIEITNYSLSGFDSSTAGEKTITVSYLEASASFTVNVRKKYETYQLGNSITATLDLDTYHMDVNGSGNMMDFEYSTSLSGKDAEFKKVKTITIHDGIEGIGKTVFYNCTSLNSFELADTVTKIGQQAFYGCNKLEIVSLPDSVTAIGTMAFYKCTELRSASLGKSILSIGWSAFEYCEKLESVTFSGKITEIPMQCFSDCYALHEISLPDSVTVISRMAFLLCKSLITIKLPNSLKTLDDNTFHECSSLTEISIPSNVEKIGNNAFMNCSALTHIYINKKKNTITGSPWSAPSASVVWLLVIEYTVTFKDWDGTVLNTQIVEEEVGALPPNDPVREGYSFIGWDKEFSRITEDTVITAVYAKICTIKFYDKDNILIKSESVLEGGSATPPNDIASGIDHYILSGWDKNYTNVIGDMDIYPVFSAESYTVVFKDWNSTVLDTSIVVFMEDAVPPDNPVREGYIFTGWDSDYTEITSDLVVTAMYDKSVLVSEIQVSDIYLNNGDMVPIVYTVLPENAVNKAISFSVSDKTVVSVGEDGILMANRTGTATLTLKAMDGGAVASCQITVNKADNVNSLWILPNVVYIQKGDTEVLTVNTIAGSDADTSVVWTSSDTAVVTVNKNGKITALKQGNVMITARLKMDASKYSTSEVHVLAGENYLRQLYAQDSVHKELFIHSVSGKFNDIRNDDIVEESMMIKEAVCTSTPVVLGGCISNSFEILVSAKRFIDHEPSGEIQVYQVIDGCRVNLFNGIIDSAEKQENKITRKLIAYDKMYTKGDIDLTAWFTNMNFPITVGWLRSQIFRRIGIACQSVKLPCDSFLIYQNYEYYTEENVEEKKKRIIYDIPDKLKAVDIIRDICEVNGMFGWMNRTGAFEYISPKNTRQAKLYPITIQDGEKSYPVNAVEIYLDDKEIDPSITCIGSYNDKQKYNIDDSNFIVNATRGETVYPQTYNSYQETYKNQILNALHEKKWVSFTCRQRFDPGLKIGSDIIYQNDKQFSDGTKYVWKTVSAILERTIEGVQSVTETITASVGYYSASDNKRKVSKKVNNNSKAISNLKSQVSSLGNDYYGDGSGGGGGLKVVSVTEIPTAPDSETIYLIQGEVVVE